jgi:hypothetical protein
MYTLITKVEYATDITLGRIVRLKIYRNFMFRFLRAFRSVSFGMELSQIELYEFKIFNHIFG